MTHRIVAAVIRTLVALSMAALTPIGATAQESQVMILTPGRIVGGGFVTVKIAWCSYGTGTSHFDVSSHVIKANNVDVTSDFDFVWDPAACNAVGPFSDEFYSSTGTVAVNPETGLVEIFADASNPWNYHWQAFETYSPLAPRIAVRVTADNAFQTVFQSAVRSERFTVTNLSNGTENFGLIASGCAAGAVGACTVNPSSVSLASGGSAQVTVNHTASVTVGAAGLLQLRAASYRDGNVMDSAWVDLTIAAIQGFGVTLVGTAPGLNGILPRGACVTIALTAAAASECGDLRLVHGVAAVRTMGSARAPTLLYNSQHAAPKPLVIADVRLSYNVALPDTVIACIIVGTTPRGCKRWPARRGELAVDCAASWSQATRGLGPRGTRNSSSRSTRRTAIRVRTQTPPVAS